MFLERLLKVSTGRTGADRAAPYVACLVAVAVAIALRIAAAPLLGGRQNYVFFYPALFACAFLAGWRGGLFSTGLLGIAGYWLMAGRHDGRIDTPAALAAVLFIGNGALATLLIAGMWRAIEELGRERGRAEARAALHAELFGDLNARTGHFLSLVSSVLAEQSRQEARAGAASALTEAAAHASLLARVHGKAAGGGPDLVELQPFLAEVLKSRAHAFEFSVAGGPSIQIDREQAVSLGVVLLSYLEQKGEGQTLSLRIETRAGLTSISMTGAGRDNVSADAPGPLVRSMLRQLRGKVSLELDGLSLDQLLAAGGPPEMQRQGATLH